jgi:hypothetical protein
MSTLAGYQLGFILHLCVENWNVDILAVGSFDVDISTVGNFGVDILAVGNFGVDILAVGNLGVDILAVGNLGVELRTQHLNLEKMDCAPRFAGANPTVVSYNASAVKIYSATFTPAHFEKESIFFYKLRKTLKLATTSALWL